MEHNNKYIINIFERYSDLKKSNKKNQINPTAYMSLRDSNNYLWKIFEYYSCLKLSEEYKKPFYEYDDIDSTFKEINKMSRNDTGIDCCDLDNTIVQCKPQEEYINLKRIFDIFWESRYFLPRIKKTNCQME